MPPEPIYEFGPYQIDPQRRCLTRNGEPLALPERYLDILRLLVTRAGEIVPKDALIEAAWKDVAVSDNSLEQAMSSLRRRLGPAPDGSPYIETLARRGYRFRVGVTTSAARQPDEVLTSILQPYRMFVEGRAAIETLERDAVLRAREAFDEVVATDPDYAPGHVGLANALALGFDATRTSGRPDVEGLQRAVHHAREACRFDADSGEAWATLAFVLSRTGASADAVAAGRRATALEPENWRHHVRLAYAGWGDERLRAARNTLKRLPGFGLAHWLVATVHVARQAFDEAVRELIKGAAAQDHQPEGGRFGSVGLHLLLGLVYLARGEPAAAEEEFMRELAFEPAGHIYSSQACANAWCAIGAIRLREEKVDDAVAAFGRALDRVSGHTTALAAMSVVAVGSSRASLRTRLHQRIAALEGHGARIDAAVAAGVVDVLAGRHADAADRIRAALDATPEGSSAGWTLPIEPLLRIADHPDAWVAVLATVRGRAA